MALYRRSRAGLFKPACTALCVILLVVVVVQRSASAPDDVAAFRPLVENSVTISESKRRMKLRAAAKPNFENMVFTGHVSPDLDSVASALGAAYMFDGVASIPGKLNQESASVLATFGVKPPQKLKEIYKGQDYVIVDHNEALQVPKILAPSKLRGIIDHHALSKEPPYFPRPGYVYIRAWGSCSTVIASLYVEYGVGLPEALAGVLLGGIVSDTLALSGPTTTHEDVEAAKWLAGKAGIKATVDGIRKFALKQFQAKGNITGLPLINATLLDFKQYELTEGASEVSVGWSTIETVEPFYSHFIQPTMLSRFIKTLETIKRAKNLKYAFLSIVNILDKQSVFIAPSEKDMQVLVEAFPTRKHVGSTMNGSPLVSRKREFLPPIRTALRRRNQGN